MTNGIPDQSRSTRNRISAATLVVAVALCVYWGALFYGTHTKLPPGFLPGHSDKIVHFASYAGLAALLISLRATRGTFPWFSVIGRWMVLALYGAFDELTQLLVNRSADFYDWCADVVGSAVGLAIVTFVLWCLRPSAKASDLSSSVADGISG